MELPVLSKDTINKLTKIFYSDEFGMRSASLLYKEARKAGINITHEQLKKGFYDHQEVVQQFAPQSRTINVGGTYWQHAVPTARVHVPNWRNSSRSGGRNQTCGDTPGARAPVSGRLACAGISLRVSRASEAPRRERSGGAVIIQAHCSFGGSRI